MEQKSNRSRLIGLIHVQKTVAKLDDETYRTIISGATGKESCTECTTQELRAIFRDLNLILEKQDKKTFSFYPRWEPPTLKDAVIARAKKILGDDWENRLDSFSQSKFSKTKFRLCNKSELLRIMAFLTNVERKERIAE